MTIFARRRLQAMLDELAPVLGSEKGKDLLNRLNDTNKVDQALPAEMELALLWAIHSLGDFEVEPEWWGDSRRPDAVTDMFVIGKTTAIEIAATNDNAISGEEDMDAIAIQICDVANRSRRGTGSHLYFRFREEHGYHAHQSYRRRLAPRGYKLTPSQKNAVSDWIKSEGHLSKRLRLVEEGLDVEIEYTERKQVRYHNLYSTMPPETHSLEDNPLFDLLVRKARQLRAAAPGTLRILFIADVGSTLIRKAGQFGEIDHLRRRKSAREIISHFLHARSRNVDAIVTFSPFKEMRSFSSGALRGEKPRRWNIGFFGTPNFPEPPPSLQKLATLLPEPHYEGYQARSLFRQGAFSPNSTGQYLGMTIRSNGKERTTSIDFPARLLLDLLAGRISEDRFRGYVQRRPEDPNFFKVWLDQGKTIVRAEMAPRDNDEDDDHIILHFADDAAARPFRLPEPDQHQDEPSRPDVQNQPVTAEGAGTLDSFLDGLRRRAWPFRGRKGAPR